MSVYFEDFASRVRESHPVAEDVVSLAPSQACFCLRKVSQQAGYDDKVTGCNQQSRLNCSIYSRGTFNPPVFDLYFALGKLTSDSQ